MKTVLILRHGKSSWANEGLADFDRPLNGRGFEATRKMGQLLRELDLMPELIASSTALRAKQTAELISAESGYEGTMTFMEQLYHAPAQSYLTWLSNLPNSIGCVMVVGHNPGLEELVIRMTAQQERIATATLVQVDFDCAEWQALPYARGKLIGVWRPRELP